MLPPLRMSDPPIQCFLFQVSAGLISGSWWRPLDLEARPSAWRGRRSWALAWSCWCQGPGVRRCRFSRWSGATQQSCRSLPPRRSGFVGCRTSPVGQRPVGKNDQSSRTKFCAFRLTRIFIQGSLAKTRNFHPRRFLVLNAVEKKKNHKFKLIGSTPWPYHHEITTPPQFSKCR